jgi:hypothetical protein
MTKKKPLKFQLLKELSFEDVITSDKIYPSRFLGTTKRIKIFKKIGYTCVSCGRSACKMRKYKDQRQDRIFWSITSSDDIEITIDHITPKLLGGKDNIENLQPMCRLCNWEKGNILNVVPFISYRGPIEGKELYVKSNKKLIYKGIIEKIDINPHNQKDEIFIISERGSSYKINKNAYIKES